MYSIFPYLFTTHLRLLMTLYKKPFENIVGNGENAGNQHFLLFPECFLPFLKQISIFQLHLFFLSANAFNLGQCKLLLFSKGLNKFQFLSILLAVSWTQLSQHCFGVCVWMWVFAWICTDWNRYNFYRFQNNLAQLFNKKSYFKISLRWFKG